MDEELLICCLKCKRLKSESGDWVQVDSETVQIIADRLRSGYCDTCADQLYDELGIAQSTSQKASTC